MRESEFRAYLMQHGAASTARVRTSNCRTIERCQKINLDDEYQKNQLNDLYNLFTYTSDDAAMRRENPSQIQIKGVIKDGLDTYRQAVNLYKKFCEKSLILAPSETPIIENNIEVSEESPLSEISFALESQLRDFIAQNIGSITVNNKNLRLYVDSNARDGIEYPTSVGFIDILAIDEEDNFIVFELKRARSPDHAIGQIARYMGWVTQTIGKDKKVSGVIVAKSIDEKLKYAQLVVPNVSLFEYEVNFKLNPVIEVGQS